MDIINPSLLGAYGSWAASLPAQSLPKLSFRRKEFQDIDLWREKARKKVLEFLFIPEMKGPQDLKLETQYEHEGLQIEELSWQLAYGPRPRATFLRPKIYKEKLPGVLALHDHSGDKYFGRRKIIDTPASRHSLMSALQIRSYGGKAWANELAKQGYAVLVSDVLGFGSRKILMKDVPFATQKLNDPEEEDHAGIEAYNTWAGEWEQVIAKSLFSAGTSWSGLMFFEDQTALNILADREEVDEKRLGCGGLSGGGLRSALLSGLDERIRCAFTAGFMTSWRDFVHRISIKHTWMAYIPGLAHYLDFPEIMALRAPLPSLVLHNESDHLFSLPEMKAADQIMREVYHKAGAADKFRASYYPGGHKFDQDMQKEAFEYFHQYL